MFLTFAASASTSATTASPTVGLDALTTLAVIPTIVWGLVAGSIAAWIGHRYASGNDADGYEIAVLSDATCPRCNHVITLAESGAREVVRVRLVRATPSVHLARHAARRAGRLAGRCWRPSALASCWCRSSGSCRYS